MSIKLTEADPEFRITASFGCVGAAAVALVLALDCALTGICKLANAKPKDKAIALKVLILINVCIVTL